MVWDFNEFSNEFRSGDNFSLANLLKWARNKNGWPISTIAKHLKRNDSEISMFENGKRHPNLILLKDWIEFLCSEQEPNPNSGCKVEHDKKKFEKVALLLKLKSECNQTSYSSIDDMINEALHVNEETDNPTLCHFPEGFKGEWVVVSGDRREPDARTQGDLLAYSGSTLDLRHLFGLGLPKETKIVSDKYFRILEDKDLVKNGWGERNWLVIGSPAVNICSRRFNGQCVFSINIPSDLKNIESKIKGWGWVGDSKHRHAFQKMLSLFDAASPIGQPIRKLNEIDPQHVNSIKEISLQNVEASIREIIDISTKDSKGLMHRLRGDNYGIFDPADNRSHGLIPYGHKDYGVISMSLNPLNPDSKTRMVYIAGLHGIATSKLIHWLGDTTNFKGKNGLGHPFGGAVECVIPEVATWVDKIDGTTINWQTKPYSVDTISNNLDRAIDQFSKEPIDPTYEQFLKYVTREELEQKLKLIRLYKDSLSDTNPTSTRSSGTMPIPYKTSNNTIH